MKLSIIVPVYNEERTVREIINKILKAKLQKGISREVILINDGSRDRSLQYMQAMAKKNSSLIVINNKGNSGKGFSISEGLKKAKGDYIIIQDADLEYNPQDYFKLLDPIIKGQASVVYGTRLLTYPLRISGQKRTPLITHYIGNKFLTFLTNLLYGTNITDMETCYKVFKKSVLSGISIKSKRFEFEPEITAKISKMGIKIFEVPIDVKPRGYNEGKKINWIDGFTAIWTLIKFRFVD